MSGQMDFYYKLLSPPCRSVLLTAKAIGVELNTIVLNVDAGEQMKPEFVKINPEHTIPTLVDNGFAVWESRAIMIYLVEKYAKTDSLYPKCPKKRAVINQRLFFDLGVLYKSFADYYYPKLFGIGTFNSDNFAKMETAFEFLNTFLEGQKYAAGDNLTLADIALVASVSTFDVVNFDISKYGNVDSWYKHVATVLPGYELNRKGMADFKQFCK